MERISNIALILGACIVGLVLFILGYSTVRYYKSKGRWAKEFWIAVAIVLAFLSTTFYRSVSGDPDESRDGRAEETKSPAEQSGVPPKGGADQQSNREQKLTTEQETKIKELIKQLGNDDFQTREKAQEELIKLGKSIKPYLEPFLESEDMEVRHRAKKIWIALENDIEDRVSEIEKINEWKQLRKLFKDISKYLPKEKIGNDQTWEQFRQQHTTILEKIKGLKEITSKDDKILPVKSSLIQIAIIAGKVIWNLSPKPKPTCYSPLRPPLPRKNKDYQIQQELLDRNLREGKITQEVYGKVKATISRYEEDAMFSEREYMIDDLDSRNTVLIFRLLREVYEPKTPIKWEEVEPKLKEKINQLIKDLGSEDWKTRDSAQQALIQIDEPAVPALRETLDKSNNPEVKQRVKKILEELE